MSTLEVLKTKTGIKNFTLRNGDEDEIAMAFEYLDRKSEVHSLKQECVPLYLEENTKVSVINLDQSGSFLLAVTPNVKPSKSYAVFKIWDLSNVLGFTPKEIQLFGNGRQIIQDGKLRCHLVFSEAKSDVLALKLDSLDSLVALHLENEISIWKATKKDSNVVSLQLCNSLLLKKCQLYADIALLQFDGEYSLVAGEAGCLLLWSFDRCTDFVSHPILQKPSGALPVPQRFFRISKSTLIFNDDGGKVWVFSLKSTSFANIKLPGLQNGCHVFTVITRKQKKCITLAVCNEAHAINIYELPDFATSIPEKVTLCERPLKILFSIAPVDALRFIKPNCIALASSSNRTLTLWRI